VSALQASVDLHGSKGAALRRALIMAESGRPVPRQIDLSYLQTDGRAERGE